MNDLSSFLFARGSLLEGFARVLDLGGTLNTYNTSETPEEADERAMAADWAVVGDDIYQAAQSFDQPAA